MFELKESIPGKGTQVRHTIRTVLLPPVMLEAEKQCSGPFWSLTAALAIGL